MELETRRLLLRPLRDDDAHAMALGLNNLNVSRNLARVTYPYTQSAASEFIQRQRGFDPRDAICAITFKCASDELIGLISYEVTPSGQYHFGYWLRECCWHMGLMSEAASALVHHAFAHAKVDALNSGYHTDNPHSGRILRKLGFVELGVEKEDCLALGHKVDCMKLRLTRERWMELRR